MTKPSFVFKLEKGIKNLRKPAAHLRLAKFFCRFARESESCILKKFFGFTDSFWRKAVRKIFSFMDSEFSIRQKGIVISSESALNSIRLIKEL